MNEEREIKDPACSPPSIRPLHRRNLTAKDYEAAIERLRLAMGQLQPDGELCAICGDNGHQAFECRFNPLRAVVLCMQAAEEAAELHDRLHELTQTRTKAGEPDHELVAGFADDALHEFLHYLYQDAVAVLPGELAEADTR